MNKVFLGSHHQVLLLYNHLQNEMKIEIVTYRNFPLCKPLFKFSEFETYFCLKITLITWLLTVYKAPVI